MVVCINLKRYPVYQIGIEDQQKQSSYTVSLRDELFRHGISSSVLQVSGQPESYAVLQALRQHDIVFINGPAALSVKQITVGENLLENGRSLNWKDPDSSNAADISGKLLADAALCLADTPVWACILIGGKSSRMGRPKHLLKDIQGRTWLERVVASIRPCVAGIVFSGSGTVPPQLNDIPRLPDIPGVQGPMNGILSAGRWQPHVSWLLLACDMPEIHRDGVDWLLSGRKPGCWGRVPRTAETGYDEPLFAWYDFRAIPLFEQKLGEGIFRLNSVVSHEKIENPLVPGTLRHNWQNVNTPEQLSSYSEK